jgi:NCAIR mutase (PurE)-related protein
MDTRELRTLLENIRNGKVSLDDGLMQIQELPYKDIGHTKFDHMREMRKGYPEVIYGAGKTIQQLKDVLEHLKDKTNNILMTRIEQNVFQELQYIFPVAEYNQLGRTMTVKRKPVKYTKPYVAVITAGTSDLPVAEEAAVTLDLFGNRVERITDVGVAGIHRLFDVLKIVRMARVVIVVAGMEGALASVVGGLVDKPVIAVPTSVGYGAHFGGLAPLLAMLNSCASGIGVVNIDNGFGAAYLASTINKLT